MIIIHPIDDFLFELFPFAKGAVNASEVLKEEMSRYYTVGPYSPRVKVKGNFIEVSINTDLIASQQKVFQEVLNLSEQGKYEQSKNKLVPLIEKAPQVSEYHRILGQILSEQGDQEGAIDALIDALRWDPKNGWALLMMGNIFARSKNDFDTAFKYYEQAVKANPEDNITVNNIAGILMQQGKLPEAKEYFYKAMEIDRNYPNTHLGLGIIAEMEGDLDSAFYSIIESIKTNKTKDAVYQNSLRKAFEVARKIVEQGDGMDTVKAFLYRLEEEGGHEIELAPAPEILTAAKIEFAENYGRETHIIRYKPGYPAVEHLMMHEALHLQLVIEARKEDLNQLFVTSQQQKGVFAKDQADTLRKLRKMGLSEESLAGYTSSLFEGINLQVYNAPIDLFIEDIIYKEYSNLRAYQFLSLYGLLQEGIKAVTDKKILELSPKDIVSKSRIYNLVSAMQFKELYGVDLLKDYNAFPFEVKQAEDFYKEFEEYRKDRQPGEEYEVVQHWAEDMRLENYFELISEKEYREKRTDLEGILESIEQDPYGLESPLDPFQQREMEKFQASHGGEETNMAVVMFMVDALQFFKGMPKDKVKQIAFEIATMGIAGIHPDKQNYIVPSIKGKSFSGYHLMAYYYVSWALALPEMLKDLQLPFDNEYALAKQLSGKPNE
ncbi:tetratricopeptide repeat protein [Rufibacter glacialis]|uniref:Tetratricopeptide repeat protein n=1 Tax=Rufibacter glacialis TaxID=1259555 RepID=A0A5M8QL75_9BACT|nr:tetratricopeptide repeat protein [Rufibacter glacialis]KAA6435516.1 tetratricopeptide repeat protein [Rufibacter glacialis]GGK64176.1 hypothetical protein GCM10011405_10200 [Rufibacter glacialis]